MSFNWSFLTLEVVLVLLAGLAGWFVWRIPPRNRNTPLKNPEQLGDGVHTTQKQIVFYLGDGDEKLVEWYESIPPEFRSAMVRMAVLNAVFSQNSGLADVKKLFPNGSSQPDHRRK